MSSTSSNPGRGGGNNQGRGGGGGGGGGGSNQGRRGGGGGNQQGGRGEGSRSGGRGGGSSGSQPKEPVIVANSSVPFVDTHCHLDRIFENDRHQGKFSEYQAKKGGFPANFDGVISIFCDPSAFSPSLGVWRELLGEDGVYGAFGIHPHNAKYYTDAVEERIVEALSHPKAVAWGECGLDYHYNNSPQEVQREVFKRQILKAVELNKPLVVHSRDAEEDTLYILQDHLPADWPVHLHCHGGSDEFTIALMRHFSNLVFGFTGAITFTNASQRRMIAEVVPLERIVLETDGPYMAPVPFRGQTAHPGMIPYVAHQIAQLKKRDLDEVLRITRENTKRVYGF